jgi:hypothetical protein
MIKEFEAIKYKWQIQGRSQDFHGNKAKVSNGSRSFSIPKPEPLVGF